MRGADRVRNSLLIVVPGIILVCFAVAVVSMIRSEILPATVWLPKPIPGGDRFDTYYRLPVSSKVVETPYGKALLFESKSGWTKLYQFASRPQLRASECPNIAERDSLMPSDCEYLGDFHGADVYTIHRRLPSGLVEYFVDVGGTFLSAHISGDGYQHISVLESYTDMPRGEAERYLRGTRELVGPMEAIINQE